MSPRPTSAQDVAMVFCAVFFIAGAILLGSEVRDFFRDRSFEPAVGSTMTVISGLGFCFAFRSQRRADARANRRSMLRIGAFQLSPEWRTPELVRLSFLVAERLAFQRMPDEPPLNPDAVNARQLSDWIAERLQWQAENRRLMIDPSGLASMRQALTEKLPDIDLRHIRLGTPIASIVNGRRLTSLWDWLMVRFGRPLPHLILPAWVGIVCGILAVALMLVVAIPILSSTAPGSNRPLPAGAGIAIRIGCILFVAVAWVVLVGLSSRVFSRPPETCSTIAGLVAHLLPHGGPDTSWTPELVWDELRHAIGEAYGLDPADVHEEMPLVRSVGMPIVDLASTAEPSV